MTDRPDPTHDRISRWLEAEAQGELPDRVLQLTFERTRRSPQDRPGWRRRLAGTSRVDAPTRRFQMLNAVRAIAATAIIVAGAGLAMNQAAPSPGIASPAPSVVPSPTPAGAAVSGRFIFDGTRTVAPTVTTEAGVNHFRGETWVGLGVEASDPRLAGEATATFDKDVLFPGGAGVVWGTTDIVNAEGTWTGTFVGPLMPNDGNDWRNIKRLTGTGAYAGLSALLLVEGTGEFEGVIFPGPLPDEG